MLRERQRYHRPDAASDAALGQSILEQCWPRLSTPCKLLVPSGQGTVRAWFLLDGEWDEQGWRQGAMESLQLSQWDGGMEPNPENSRKGGLSHH